MKTFDEIRSKVLEKSDAIAELARWKASGDRIVFTNGCFDILHYGHINLLSRAADLGDKLIIGLNSDSSVKTLGKGPTRPIQDEHSRSTILSALSFIDAVILFSDETPLALIQAIMPDVLVKGGDWKPEEIVGSEEVLAAGGEVRSLAFVEGFSTTSIEKRLRG